MSVVFSGTNQGKFTSTGQNKILNIRSDVDYIHVYNFTKAIATGTGIGVQYYFQRGMDQGKGLIYKKLAGGGPNYQITIGEIAANQGFFLIDTSVNVPGASVALTSITGVSGVPAPQIPIVATGNTAGLVAGDIVRLFGVVNGAQYSGLDFTIDTVVLNTSYRLPFMPAGIANTLAGTFRKIPYNPIYYPRSRYISSITQATQAVVKLTVTHGYKVGQVVSFIVPQVANSATTYGMTEINGLQGTILAIDTTNNTITVDIDSSGFTAFALPTTAEAAAGYTFAQVVPVGQNTAESLNAGVDILSDATVNEALVGIQLIAGANSPAGALNDVIYYVAGKSFSVSN